MGCLGNVLWFVFGGAVSGLSWCLAGCLWCITVVGIPVGMQCFKFAALSFFPCLLYTSGNTPVIVLTAKDGLDEKIGLLTSGADDYITKPFEIQEVLAPMPPDAWCRPVNRQAHRWTWAR